MKNIDTRNIALLYESKKQTELLMRKIQEEIDKNPLRAQKIVNEFLGDIGKSISGGVKSLTGAGKDLLKGDLKGVGSNLMKAGGNAVGTIAAASAPGSAGQQINQSLSNALKTGNLKDAAGVIAKDATQAAKTYGPMLATAAGVPAPVAAAAGQAMNSGGSTGSSAGEDNSQIIQQIMQAMQGQDSTSLQSILKALQGGAA